jgi:hypothetical protein
MMVNEYELFSSSISAGDDRVPMVLCGSGSGGYSS